MADAAPWRRRSLLLAMPALALSGALPARGAADPFTLGVASGESTASSLVLWTRLAPEPLRGGGLPDSPVEVSWLLAEDEALRRPLRHGRVMALPGEAHSVHLEISGLQPDRWYWYRFAVMGPVIPSIGPMAGMATRRRGAGCWMRSARAGRARARRWCSAATSTPSSRPSCGRISIMRRRRRWRWNSSPAPSPARTARATPRAFRASRISPSPMPRIAAGSRCGDSRDAGCRRRDRPCLGGHDASALCGGAGPAAAAGRLTAEG